MYDNMTRRAYSRSASVLCLILGIVFLTFAGYRFLYAPMRSAAPDLQVTEYHRILDQYTFDRLAQRRYQSSPIQLEKMTEKTADFTTYLFSFFSDGKKVSGQVHIPSTSGKHPVLVMVRGYVDKEIYVPGVGTRRAAEVYAKHRYVTIAPDFLGYGNSASESADMLEARFEKPVTVLNLLASLGSLPQVDTRRVGLWGHSNGGQIVLSVLEISKRPYPTVLWAPVSQKFPDSILQFVDELPDKGEYLRGQLDLFHERYKDEDYSIQSHVEDIRAPIQLHQGTADALVPVAWSNDVYAKLKANGNSVNYFVYEGEDHNFSRGKWSQVVERDVQFFQKQL